MAEPRTQERFKRVLGVELLSWDTSEIIDSALQDRKENWQDHYGDEDECPSEDRILKDIYGDHDLFTWEWECTMDNLTGILTEREPGGEWSASANGMGWQARDATKDFHASTGKEFVKQVMPRCECTWKMFSYGDDGMAMQIFSHDNPTGFWLYVWPRGEISESVIRGIMEPES